MRAAPNVALGAKRRRDEVVEVAAVVEAIEQADKAAGATGRPPLRVVDQDIPVARQEIVDELLQEIHRYLVVYGPQYVARPGMLPAGELHLSWGQGRGGGWEMRCTPIPHSLPVWRRDAMGEARSERKAA